MNSIFAFNNKKIRAAAFAVSVAFIMIAGILYINRLNGKLPVNIYVVRNEETTVDLGVPATGVCETASENLFVTDIDFSRPVTFTAATTGSYTLKIKLFNLFDLKTVNVNVVDSKYVYPGGMQIGMYLKTNGVLVSDIGTVKDENENEVSPCKNIFCKGDYIVDVNGEEVNSKIVLCELVNKCGQEVMSFKVKRDNSIVRLEVKPAKTNDGTYKLGLWVKDDSQGIGTLTYITEENEFAALGHGISDGVTNELLDMKNGKIYKTRIMAVIKGENGTPGELMGSINYMSSNVLGEISCNTNRGIYGKFKSSQLSDYKSEAMEIGYSQNVKKGCAYIRMYENGMCKDYEIDIYSINNGESKNLSFKVTSEELLDKTNGIVQGMSGSPIIQDGKLIGAVTHVFVDDSTKGYGIFIENMLEH